MKNLILMPVLFAGSMIINTALCTNLGIKSEKRTNYFDIQNCCTNKRICKNAEDLNSCALANCSKLNTCDNKIISSALTHVPQNMFVSTSDFQPDMNKHPTFTCYKEINLFITMFSNTEYALLSITKDTLSKMSFHDIVQSIELILKTANTKNISDKTKTHVKKLVDEVYTNIKFESYEDVEYLFKVSNSTEKALLLTIKNDLSNIPFEDIIQIFYLMLQKSSQWYIPNQIQTKVKSLIDEVYKLIDQSNCTIIFNFLSRAQQLFYILGIERFISIYHKLSFDKIQLFDLVDFANYLENQRSIDCSSIEPETDIAAKKEEIKKNYKVLIDNIIDIACEKIPSTRDRIFFTHKDCVFNYQRYPEATHYSFKYLTDFIKFAGVRALPIITSNNLPSNKDKLSDLSTCIRKYTPYSFETSMELTRVSQIIDIMLH